MSTTPILRAAIAAAALVAGTQALAQVTFYARDGYHGPSLRADGPIENFARAGFNDRASSVVVDGGRWEICEHAGFHGRCAMLRPGRYHLSEFGMNNAVSSVRPVVRGHARWDDDDRPGRRRGHGHWDDRPAPVAVVPAPAPAPEPFYQVPVTQVTPLPGPAQQRCWTERQQVQTGGQPNIGGAVVGGLLGGALGHQVGGGSGKDIATAGGAAAGAVIGANVGRGAPGVAQQDVQRCEMVPGPVTHWRVSYSWQGQLRETQLDRQPGPSIMVDRHGTPRL